MKNFGKAFLEKDIKIVLFFAKMNINMRQTHDKLTKKKLLRLIRKKMTVHFLGKGTYLPGTEYHFTKYTT